MKNRLKEKLLTILPMSQEELKGFLEKELLKYYADYYIQKDDGFLCVSGNQKICLVAHMDVSGRISPSIERIVHNDNYMTAIDSVLGGDDRCGVATILCLLEDGFRPSIIFTEDEEIGAVGARKFVNCYKSVEANYFIQLDRRSNNLGTDNVVFYDCGNKEFKDYVLGFGFVEEFGSFSDISILCKEYDLAGVNISIGYYSEHTRSEYINLLVLGRVYSKVTDMLEDEKNSKAFDFQEEKWYSSYNEKYACAYGYEEDELYDSYYERDKNKKDGQTKIMIDGKYYTIEEYYEKFFEGANDKEDEGDEINQEKDENDAPF